MKINKRKKNLNFVYYNYNKVDNYLNIYFNKF